MMEVYGLFHIRCAFHSVDFLQDKISLFNFGICNKSQIAVSQKISVNAKSSIFAHKCQIYFADFFLRDKSFPKDTQCAAFLFMAPKVYTNSLWPKLGKVKSQIMFARARHDFAKFLNKQLRIMPFFTF